MRALFARGAFSTADAAAAGATLAAYAIGLIPFVLIRSAVATFYAREDTATPVKAALPGVAVNVALKIVLFGSLAQVGLALATAVGAWVNLLLVIAFRGARRLCRIRSRASLLSLLKFLAIGLVLGGGAVGDREGVNYAALSQFAAWTTLRDEAALQPCLIIVTV